MKAGVVIRLAVSSLLLGLLAWRLDWGGMFTVLAGLHGGWLALAFVLFLGCNMLGGLRWWVLARPLGFEHPPSRFVNLYLIGGYFNLLLPTSVGGDVIRAWKLDDNTGRRMIAFMSVAVDRISGLVVLLAFACTATLLSPSPMPEWVILLAWGLLLGAGSGVMVLPVMLSKKWEQLGRSKSWLDRVVLIRIARLPQELRAVIAAYRDRPGVVTLSTLMSVVVQAAAIGVLSLLCLALRVPVGLEYLAVAVPVVTMLTLVPISLNGMGVREAGLALLLMPAGVPAEVAVSLSLLWFLVILVTGLVGGVVHLVEG